MLGRFGQSCMQKMGKPCVASMGHWGDMEKGAQQPRHTSFIVSLLWTEGRQGCDSASQTGFAWGVNACRRILFYYLSSLWSHLGSRNPTHFWTQNFLEFMAILSSMYTTFASFHFLLLFPSCDQSNNPSWHPDVPKTTEGFTPLFPLSNWSNFGWTT